MATTREELRNLADSPDQFAELPAEMQAAIQEAMSPKTIVAAEGPEDRLKDRQGKFVKSPADEAGLVESPSNRGAATAGEPAAPPSTDEAIGGCTHLEAGEWSVQIKLDEG
eukprot:gene24164-9751_t